MAVASRSIAARITTLPREALAGAAIATVLSLLNLGQPFAWDQAMFALGAERLLGGGALYVDYWDSKQPGVFAFFALAGQVFGLNEIGVHALESCWTALFALVACVAFKGRWRHTIAVFAAPVLVVGYACAVSTDWHLTQVEGLVGLPLLAALAASIRAAESGSGRWWCVAGVASGVVAMFKLLLLPIPAALAIAAFAWARPRDRAWPAPLVRGLAAWCMGFALPVALTIAALVRSHAFDAAWDAWFVYPARVSAAVRGFAVENFIDGAGWFFANWAPVLALAVLGLSFGRRRERDVVPALLVLWFVLGAAVILAQRISGWQYQFLLLAPPVGALAADGLDVIADRLEAGTRASRVALAAAATLLCATAVGSAALKAAYLAKDRVLLDRPSRLRHRIRASRGNAYYQIGREVAFLRAADARPGPLFVIGHPLFYWLSGRRQPVAHSGGVLTPYVTAREWHEVVDGLRRTRTPYVFLDPEQRSELERSRPASSELLACLTHDYRVLAETRAGTWYARVADTTASSSRP